MHEAGFLRSRMFVDASAVMAFGLAGMVFLVPLRFSGMVPFDCDAGYRRNGEKENHA